jgi:Smg protein
MLDVLVYLFENYYHADSCPDHDTLTRKLHAAGFENGDITEALDWLKGLTRCQESSLPEALEKSVSLRAFCQDEQAKLSTESRGFLAFLESARVLSPLLRELIIERAMALESDYVGLEKFKVIVLMVLWTRRGSVDALILDELLPDGQKRQMH